MVGICLAFDGGAPGKSAAVSPSPSPPTRVKSEYRPVANKFN